MKKTLLTIALIAIASIAQAGKPEKLAAASAKWLEAFNAHDVEGVVAVYSADALLLPPNAGMLKGTDDIRATWTGLVEAGISAEFETVSMKAKEGIGWHVGTFTMFDADGNSIDQGKFIELWKAIDGDWKMVADQWNSDLPCPPAAE